MVLELARCKKEEVRRADWDLGTAKALAHISARVGISMDFTLSLLSPKSLSLKRLDPLNLLSFFPISLLTHVHEIITKV